MFGLFMVAYPQWAGAIFNIAVMLLTLGMIFVDINRIAKKMDIKKSSLFKVLGVASLSNLLILLVSIGLAALVGFLLGIKEYIYYSLIFII